MSKRKKKNKVAKLTEEEYGKYILSLKNEDSVVKINADSRGVYGRNS